MKLDTFFGFTNAIADLTKNRIDNQKIASSSNILGLTSEDLLESINLHETHRFKKYDAAEDWTDGCKGSN